MANIRPLHGTFTLLPREDIHATLSTLSLQGGEIDSSIFGKVKVGGSVNYKVDGTPGFAFAEVLAMGKGEIWGPSAEVPAVAPGTVIGFDLRQVVATYNNAGRVEYMLPFKSALCAFDPDARLPRALGNYVMTAQDDLAQQRFQFQHQDTRLVLPSGPQRGMRITDKAGGKVAFSVERVVSVGTGSYVKKVLCQPDLCVGDLVLFEPTMSVDLTCYSVRYRFSDYQRLRGTYSDGRGLEAVPGVL